MERREFLAAGGASVATAIGGCAAVQTGSRQPDFVFEGIRTVSDVDVATDGTTFVAGSTDDGTNAVVEVDEAGEVLGRHTAAGWSSEPLVGTTDATLFVGGTTESLIAIDRGTRSIRWRGPSVRTWFFPVEDRTAYLQVDDAVVAVGVDDGRTRWSHDSPPKSGLAPTAVVGDTAVCSGGGGRITGLSTGDGTERWTHVLGGDLPPTFHRGGTVYAGTGTNAADPRATAIDAATGEVRWTVRTGDNIVSPDPGPRNVYLPDGTGTGSIAVDPETGEEHWRRGTVSVVNAGPSGPVGRSTSGDVVALEPGTGERRWGLPAGGWESTHPEIELVGSSVLVVDPDGATAVEYESGRRRWHYSTPVERLPRIDAGGSVVVVETGGSVMGFQLGP